MTIEDAGGCALVVVLVVVVLGDTWLGGLVVEVDAPGWVLGRSCRDVLVDTGMLFPMDCVVLDERTVEDDPPVPAGGLTV